MALSTRDFLNVDWPRDVSVSDYPVLNTVKAFGGSEPPKFLQISQDQIQPSMNAIYIEHKKSPSAEAVVMPGTKEESIDIR